MVKSTSLPEFIEANIECLLEDWQSFARTRLPAAERLSVDALRDGAEAILRAIAADMRSSESATEQLEKSRGELPAMRQLSETARWHAVERLRNGFTLDQLISEYRALRASVVRHWTEDSGKGDPEAFDQLIRFNESLDQSLTEAVAGFNHRLARVRDLFVGMLGHDLRDPLSAILALAQSQQARESSMAQHDAAARITVIAQRMSRMITDLLDFARTRLGGRLPIEPEPFDLCGCCRQIIDEMDASRHRSIKLECSGELNVLWDPHRISQMLSNLVRNAIRHGDEDSSITVSVREQPDGVVISVHNLGPPIPAEDHQRIFDPLARGSNSCGEGPLRRTASAWASISSGRSQGPTGAK